MLAATWPLCVATPLSEALKSHPSSATHLWSLYDAEELATTHDDGDEITSWSDVSEFVWANHDLKKPAARAATEKTYFAKSGVGGLPSVRIHGSHLCTDNDVATPSSGSITVVISFRFTRFNTYIAGEDPRMALPCRSGPRLALASSNIRLLLKIRSLRRGRVGGDGP